VYYYETVPDAQEQIDALPAIALPYYAELVTFMELTPWNGHSVNKNDPKAPTRIMPFGPHGEGMATYVIVEDPNRVVVVNVHEKTREVIVIRIEHRRHAYRPT
jgi:hypothetical protein